MNILGMLALIVGPDGDLQPALLHPARIFYLVPPENCPDDWLALKAQAEEAHGAEILGFVVEDDGLAESVGEDGGVNPGNA